MTTKPDIAKPRLVSLPIFWQVLGLSLIVLLLAIAINTTFVLNAPSPPPAGYRIEEAAKAMKSGEVHLGSGRTLKAHTTTTAPAFATLKSQNIPLFERRIANRLARELGVPDDTVWVSLVRRGPPRDMGRNSYLYVQSMDVRRREAMGDGPPPLPPEAGGPNVFFQSGISPDPGAGGPQTVFQGGPGQAGPGPGGPGQTESGQKTNDQKPVGPNAGGLMSTGQYSTGQHLPGVPPEFERDSADVIYPAFAAAWKLKDGHYRVIDPPKTLIDPWQVRLLLGFGLTAVLILPLAWFLARGLSRPIVAFSDAASRLSFEDNAPPILSVGPREVRQAADVLNAMQERIKKQVESRTALMGAIAHDLKTPLARMRLRIEDLPGPLRDKLNGDIAHMDGLIRSAMSFTSAHKMADTLRPLDMTSLVETLADDLAAVCPMEPPLIEHNVMVKGDSVALKRIITNLVENAGRYATGCRIELAVRGKTVEIIISDNGPGLPASMLETVFEPFYRMESSRNRDTGGTGLGLSVARSLAEAQGGTLTLANRYEGAQVTGLEAKLTLPRLTMK